MRRPYFILEDVRFGTETEGYNPNSDSFDALHTLRRLLLPAFRSAEKATYGDEGIPFATSGQNHFYTRWELGTERTVRVDEKEWFGLELKSRILQGAEGLQELIDAHAILADVTTQADGTHSFVTNETCSFQLHVSPADSGSDSEPRVAGNFTERQIRNLAYAIANNETAYKALLPQERLESKYCKVYSSTEIPEGRTIADILDPAAMTLEQVTGKEITWAMISLAGLNHSKRMKDKKNRDPDEGPPPPPVYTIQFRAKEGVTLPDFSSHAFYAALMVNFTSLAMNNPHVMLEEAKRLTLNGPSTGQTPSGAKIVPKLT